MDAALLCGDALPIRDDLDLRYVHCPKKYRVLGDYSTFWSGSRSLPVPVMMIGGNHEPWNYLDEYPNGGELIKNLYFLGRVGVIETHGLRIGGVSAIHSDEFFGQPHPVPPYPENIKKRLAFHTEHDIERAFDLGKLDILLLHEWPSLMRRAQDASWPYKWHYVGSEYLSLLVEHLEPRKCFCGHMHHTASITWGSTEIICLGDFSRDPEQGHLVVDM